MNSGNEWIRSLFKLWVKAGIICHVLGGAFAVDVRAGTVVLGWDHNTESDLAGYYLYSGPASGQYTQKIDVGLTNQYTVTQLLKATPYYFVVTAYNDSGLESDPSNEVRVFINVAVNPFKLIQVLSTADGVQFSWQSMPGDVYKVWSKPTLRETAWHAASPEITADGPVTSWLAPADRAAEFYQVRFLR